MSEAAIARSNVRFWRSRDRRNSSVAPRVLASEEEARADGYNGFRTHGNIGWLGRNQWEDFQDYETDVTRALRASSAVNGSIVTMRQRSLFSSSADGA
jgi:hypothetical protein